MSYKLKKPYTEKERMDFIVEYNHQKGLRIEEGGNTLYALECWESLDGDEVVDNKEVWEAEQEEIEKSRIEQLFLTAADVERGIYKATGMDFEDIIEALSKGEGVGEGLSIDLKALKIELRANNFYRGNPYVNIVGTILGFTKEQLDEFFETNDYRVLIKASVEENN